MDGVVVGGFSAVVTLPFYADKDAVTAAHGVQRAGKFDEVSQVPAHKMT
jgi:hypothetical protein